MTSPPTNLDSGAPDARERRAAVLAYPLNLLSGLIVFFVVRRSATFARWHAVQAVFFGLYAWGLLRLANVLIDRLVEPTENMQLFFIIGASSAILYWGPIGLFMWGASKGRAWRIPGVAIAADRLCGRTSG